MKREEEENASRGGGGCWWAGFERCVCCGCFAREEVFISQGSTGCVAYFGKRLRRHHKTRRFLLFGWSVYKARYSLP